MKRFGRIALLVLGGIALLAGLALVSIKLFLPNVGPAPKLTIRADTAQIERGRYLAKHVAVCVDCHSTRNWSRFAAPLVANTEGKGGERFAHEQGFPGVFYAPNLTPTHLGKWTDGEIYQAITTGVSRDGRPLFPIMPYQRFGQMDPEDIKAIVAYVRTFAPIENTIPEPTYDFPMNVIIHTIPAKATGTKRPQPTDQLAYGQYLTTFASCGECHTPVDAQAQPLPGMDFAGGREFPMPTGTVRSMNITPAKTGIGSWTKEAFIAKFKGYANGHGQNVVGEGEFNSIMPWVMYAGMSEQDLGAIYTYLRTVKPVENKVERFVPKQKQLASR